MRKKVSTRKLRNKFYMMLTGVVVVAWLYAFHAYFRYYDSIHPEIAWATPWLDTETVSAAGILLWNEVLLYTPRGGTVLYPAGLVPVRVGKGEVVAKLSVGSVITPVRTPEGGYFIAGLDGFEDSWLYSRLWPGTQLFPKGTVRLFKNGHFFQPRQAVGKLVIQPQVLRFIGYIDLNPDILKQLQKGHLQVKQDTWDTPSKATVRVHENFGTKAKVYLDLPWFAPELIHSRNYSLLVEAGQIRGLSIPESALTWRGRSQGVLYLSGTNAVFRPVKGRPLDGKRFLVTEGLKLGDAIVQNAGKAREGRVKLW